MFSPDGFLGCPQGIDKVICSQSMLCLKVVEQVNASQGLLMMDSFSKESNEYLLKKCLQERISDISSWHWVLNDLSKRLDEAIDSLRHEHNAIRVVISRIQGKIADQTGEAIRPGALCLMTDSVEEAVMQEHKYLKNQIKQFETMIDQLDTETKHIVKAKKIIEDDVLRKKKTLDIEEKWMRNEDVQFPKNCIGERDKAKKKKKLSPLVRWEKRCSSLKTVGLQNLAKAIIVRQRVRGARIQLSIDAQAHGLRVDAALKRRLHANTAKLDELKWQREETVNDLRILEEEQSTNEQSMLEQLEKIRHFEFRINDRKLRPGKELTRDDVDKTLRSELARLRKFTKEIRDNMARIESLKNNLQASITKLDNLAEDIAQVVRLDKTRINSRLVEAKSSENNDLRETENRTFCGLETIEECGESDDYPFDF